MVRDTALCLIRRQIGILLWSINVSLVFLEFRLPQWQNFCILAVFFSLYTLYVLMTSSCVHKAGIVNVIYILLGQSNGSVIYQVSFGQKVFMTHQMQCRLASFHLIVVHCWWRLVDILLPFRGIGGIRKIYLNSFYLWCVFVRFAS